MTVDVEASVRRCHASSEAALSVALRGIRAVAVLALLLGLSACVSAPTVRPTLPQADTAAAEAAQQARETALQRDSQWQLNGRVAVSNGRDGGSGRIDWRQDGERFEVSLSAPVTRQSWRLTGDPHSARLEGLDGGPREGSDAAALLQAATGWQIPVVALADWLRGARSPALPPAVIAYGDNSLPARIEQDGWRIEYEWPAGASGIDARPLRLDARKGDARVKLVVDQWGETRP